MADKKTNKDAGVDFDNKALDTAHKIWLAGIGAYGRAFDEAKDNYEKINSNSTELFDDLVKRGEKLEKTVLETINDNSYAQKASERFEKATDQIEKVVETGKTLREKSIDRFQARMDRMRSALGIAESDSGATSISALNAKIDVLMEEIASLKGEKASTLKKAAAEKEDVLSQDIQLIDGIGEKTAKAFAEEGIETFTALAALTAKEATILFTKLGVAARAAREEWFEQAKDLVAGKAPRSKA